MNQKTYKNSLLIEGDFNFNYLTNLLFIANRCLEQAIRKNDYEIEKNKKMLKNIKNLSSFLESSVEVFSRLSLKFGEKRVVIHNVEYSSETPKISESLFNNEKKEV